MPTLDTELAAIATHAARMSAEQVRALRERIVREVADLEADVARRQRTFPMHADDIDIRRDRATCARRRREVDYLNELLARPSLAAEGAS
jgi:hypothetical protein